MRGWVEAGDDKGRQSPGPPLAARPRPDSGCVVVSNLSLVLKTLRPPTVSEIRTPGVALRAGHRQWQRDGGCLSPPDLAPSRAPQALEGLAGRGSPPTLSGTRGHPCLHSLGACLLRPPMGAEPEAFPGTCAGVASSHLGGPADSSPPRPLDSAVATPGPCPAPPPSSQLPGGGVSRSL